MAKNSQPRPPKPQTPAMSPSHPHTVGAAAGLNSTPNLLSADDDEDHICPICDGDCTCLKLQPPPTSSIGSFLAAPISTTCKISQPSQPSRLKIKITVPSSMLGKRRLSAPNDQQTPGEMMSGIVNDGEMLSKPHASGSSFPLQLNGPGPSATKRRGRPPKTVSAVRKAVSASLINSGNEANASSDRSILSRPQRRGTALRNKSGGPSSPRARGTTVKKAASNILTKDRPVVLSDSDPSSEGEVDDDARSIQFPTFVSACSTMSDNDNDESDACTSSGFDSDSSIEAEEENFILTEERRAHEKARLRKELIGDEGRRKKKELHNNWVIHPRKNSVEPSGMDVDSDDEASEEEDDEQEEGEEADEGETDERGPGVGYAGVGTGWSEEDDESSFDADLFFANLSDSDSDGSSSSEDAGGESNAVSLVEVAVTRRNLDNIPFEVTEGWDGQITFTSSLEDGQGILDHDFELSTSQTLDVSHQMQDSDIEMQTSDGADGEDEGGDDCDLDESDGETTEEELVGPNGLPTERAMKLFHLPTSVSAINPLSTMSPATSPRPRNRRRAWTGPLDSPTPADILSGKIFFDDSDDQDGSVFGARSATSSKGGKPIMGHFRAEEQSIHRSVIINGSNKDVPSPFPRFKRDTGHSRSRSQFSSGSGLDFREVISSRRSSLPLPGSGRSSFQVLSPEEPMTTTSDELPPANPIDLDDVLDSSFLDSDRDNNRVQLASSSDSDSRKHISNLNRWDVISVGAFRQTREATGMTCDTPSASWNGECPTDGYEAIMKTNPLSTMMWHNKGSNSPKQGSGSGINLDISPVLLPVRDGDRTPTNIPPTPIPQTSPSLGDSQKTRKEIRREKKIKRRGPGPVRTQYQHHNQYNFHHYHSHFPNMKSRSSSSMQRTNFFGSTSGVPPLSL